MFSFSRQKAKRIARKTGWALTALSLIFVFSEHFGVWDVIRCTNELEEVHSQLETSYADVQRIYTQADPQWDCLIKLFERYSSVTFPEDKEPQAIVRSVAVDSSKKEVGPGQIAEWTAPTTPIYLIFEEWPGKEIKSEDFIIVGSIGEMGEWIEKDKNDFSFFIQNIILGTLTIAVAFLAL